jgi:hypothetical protein
MACAAALSPNLILPRSFAERVTPFRRSYVEGVEEKGHPSISGAYRLMLPEYRQSEGVF